MLGDNFNGQSFSVEDEPHFTVVARSESAEEKSLAEPRTVSRL